VNNALTPVRPGQPPRALSQNQTATEGYRTPLTGRQKAAVIVRLLLAEGAPLSLLGLSDQMQADLTQQIGLMRRIDRITLREVIEEFVTELEASGLTFPGGIEGALHMLDGHITASAASRLRRMAGTDSSIDPWDRIIGLEVERLLAVLEVESVEVGAVMLSKLPVSKAADLLGRLPGDRARRIAYAVSLTGDIAPATVRRIGISLAAQLDAQPIREFDIDPVERVGAILNFSQAATRDDVLAGLMETDAAFAEQVRKAIFTFTNIPVRIDPRDVPKIIRGVPQSVLVTALAAARGDDVVAADFILTNMSQRMASTLREEIGALGAIRAKDGEDAMNAIVAAIRDREAAGEIFLIAGDA